MSTNFEDLIVRGTRAAQPAAGIPGRVYYVTDEGKTERDSGVAWQDISDTGAAAPTSADYLVKTANAGLSAERVVTDTTDIVWDWATSTAAKANIGVDAVTYAKMQNVTASRLLGRGSAAGTGDPQEITVGGTLNFGGTVLIGSAFPFVGSVTFHGDSDYFIVAADRLVVPSVVFTAVRFWTIPAANLVPAGTAISIADINGTLTTAFRIAILRTGSDTFMPGSFTQLNLQQSGEGITLVSDGVSKWYVLYHTPGTSTTNGQIQMFDNNNKVWNIAPIILNFAVAAPAVGKLVQYDGTGASWSVPKYPVNVVGGASKLLVADGADFVLSTPTFPVLSATAARKMLVSDGTNWIGSNETWAVPGAVGQVLTSNGINWVSQAPSGGGTPGGANTQIQFNDSSAFGGDADFTWDKTNNLLTVIGAPAANSYLAGLLLTDVTAASAGNQQYSPSLVLRGQGWKTNATAGSQPIDWRVTNVPIQGAGAPLPKLEFSNNINGGSFIPGLSLIRDASNAFQILAHDVGGSTIPSYSFFSDSDTGMWGAGNVLSFAVGGALATEITSTKNWQAGSTFAMGGANSAAPNTSIVASTTGFDFLQSSGAGQWAFIKAGLWDTVTNTIADGLILGHRSTSTPAAGYGTAILLNAQSSTTNDRNAARIATAWSDATDVSRTAYLDFQLVNNAAALSSKMRLFPSGGLSVNSTTDPGAGFINANSGLKIGGVTLPLSGGSANQVLTKLSATDYDYNWVSMVNDSAYDSFWNGVTTNAPSKNAVYDYLHIADTDNDGLANKLGAVSGLGSGIIAVDSANVLSATGTTHANGSSVSGTPGTNVATITAGAGKQLVNIFFFASQVNAAATQLTVTITYDDSTTSSDSTGAGQAQSITGNQSGMIRNAALTSFSVKRITSVAVTTLGTGVGTRTAIISAQEIPQ